MSVRMKQVWAESKSSHAISCEIPTAVMADLLSQGRYVLGGKDGKVSLTRIAQKFVPLAKMERERIGVKKMINIGYGSKGRNTHPMIKTCRNQGCTEIAKDGCYCSDECRQEAQPNCENYPMCKGKASPGSVFCIKCRVAVEQRNAEILGGRKAIDDKADGKIAKKFAKKNPSKDLFNLTFPPK